jgi:hypothetical protein
MGKNVKIIPAGSQQRTSPNADAARRAQNQRIASSEANIKKCKRRQSYLLVCYQMHLKMYQNEQTVLEHLAL